MVELLLLLLVELLCKLLDLPTLLGTMVLGVMYRAILVTIIIIG
jgi:hypothetical protein